MNNAVQEEFWSTSAGRSWIALQSEMDFILRPVLDLVLQKACLSDGDRVLDVGCGTGASILEALKKVGNNGHVTGIDISQIMLDYAKTRLKKSSNFLLLKEDAQLYDFKYERVDALISRFGVMFFENTTAAFSNLSRA
ncbi:MAG: class I SAM-dependent methyltransferase, partial [Tateyamaria sp.]|nr:class I SAM-dependent methyltransferase [Tateyamaria sp.]